MRPMRPNHRFMIHPSIDSLAERISTINVEKDPAAADELRESCIQKLRSYRCEDYLKRYESEADRILARARWESVSDFASRPRKRDPQAGGT
jgi:hypothetical protein